MSVTFAQNDSNYWLSTHMQPTPHQLSETLLKTQTNEINIDEAIELLSQAQRPGRGDLTSDILEKIGGEAQVALERAAEKGLFEIVELLLQKRADIADAGTALIHAVRNGHHRVAEHLLQMRDIHISWVETCLMIAATSDHRAIANMLLQRRSDIPVEAIERAFRSAADRRHHACANLLRDFITRQK